MSESTPAQRFGPTSGVVTGVLGLVGCAGIAGWALADEPTGTSLRFALGAGVGAVLIWAYMLRPRVVIEPGGTLLLRNAFADWRVPLAEIKVAGVRVVTTVKTYDDQRYDGVAVGRSVRKIVRGDRPGGSVVGGLFGMGGRDTRFSEPTSPPSRSGPKLTDQSIPDFVTEQILYAADQARDRGLPGGPAQRLYAIPELVGLVVLAVAFAVSLFA